MPLNLKPNGLCARMFDFQAVASLEKELSDYAENQQGWARAPNLIGEIGAQDADWRARKATAAQKALREFLDACKEGSLLD